jgi:hypothetical protein
MGIRERLGKALLPAALGVLFLIADFWRPYGNAAVWSALGLWGVGLLIWAVWLVVKPPPRPPQG